MPPPFRPPKYEKKRGEELVKRRTPFKEHLWVGSPNLRKGNTFGNPWLNPKESEGIEGLFLAR